MILFHQKSAFLPCANAAPHRQQPRAPRRRARPGPGHRIAVGNAQAVRRERIALRETRLIDRPAVAAGHLRPGWEPKRRLALQVEPYKGPCKRSTPRRPGQSTPHVLKSPQRALVTVYGTSTPSEPWTNTVVSRRKRPFSKPHAERRNPAPGDRFPAAPRDDR